MNPEKQAKFMMSEYVKILSPHVQVSSEISKQLAIKEANNMLDTLVYYLSKKNEHPILYWKEVINQLNQL